jgi:hypothetical protein
MACFKAASTRPPTAPSATARPRLPGSPPKKATELAQQLPHSRREGGVSFASMGESRPLRRAQRRSSTRSCNLSGVLTRDWRSVEQDRSTPSCTEDGKKWRSRAQTRVGEHSPPGQIFVATASRGVPTHGTCLITTFSTHRLHLQHGHIFGPSCDAPPTALAAAEVALAAALAAGAAVGRSEPMLIKGIRPAHNERAANTASGAAGRERAEGREHARTRPSAPLTAARAAQPAGRALLALEGTRT